MQQITFDACAISKGFVRALLEATEEMNNDFGGPQYHRYGLVLVEHKIGDGKLTIVIHSYNPMDCVKLGTLTSNFLVTNTNP